jgi:hypothetical protein
MIHDFLHAVSPGIRRPQRIGQFIHELTHLLPSALVIFLFLLGVDTFTLELCFHGVFCLARLVQLRARRRALGGWPAWCFRPMDAVSSQARRLRLATTNSSHHLAALAAWRATQGIYRFDDTLLDELWHTPIHGELPTDLLYRMPEWCMYIEIGRARSRTGSVE